MDELKRLRPSSCRTCPFSRSCMPEVRDINAMSHTMNVAASMIAVTGKKRQVEFLTEKGFMALQRMNGAERYCFSAADLKPEEKVLITSCKRAVTCVRMSMWSRSAVPMLMPGIRSCGRCAA